jgi:hypothetical protein
MSGGLDPDPHADLSSFKIAIETLCLSIAVVQSPFASLACLRIDIRYLLHGEAAAEFQRGFQTEPSNAALYLGLNQAMQRTGKTTAERVEMMKRIPDPANMPEPLVRALVESLRESGRNDEANAVLAHRFLPRKEGEAPLQPQK